IRKKRQRGCSRKSTRPSPCRPASRDRTGSLLGSSPVNNPLASAGLLFPLLPRLHEFFGELEDWRHVRVLGIGNIKIFFAWDHAVGWHKHIFWNIHAP